MANQLHLRLAQRRKPATPVDPFAQQSPAAINAIVQSYVNRLPKPMTTGQISSQAQGMLDPVISRITQAINARTRGQADAVSGYTNTLAANLGRIGGTLGAPYQQGEAATAASNQALADRLSGTGQQTGAELASRLASINAPGAVDPAVAAAQQAGVGAGNSLYASGNAALQQLVANAASARGYGQKLPGIAALGGIQQAGLVHQQGVSDLAKGIADAEGQLPTIVGNLRSMSDTRASNRASLGADLYKTLTGQNITRATAQAGLNLDTQKASAPQIIGSSGTGYYAVGPQGSSLIVPAAPKAAPKPAAPKSVAPGSTLVDPNTGKVIYTAPPKAATPKSAKPVKPLAPGMIGEINDTVKYLSEGVPDTDKAAGTPAHSFADALEYMREHGYLSTPQLTKATVAALKRRYPAAEIGIAAGKVAGPGMPTAIAPPQR